jgi:hypothetical protein
MGVAPTRREFVRSVRDFPLSDAIKEQAVSGLVFRRDHGHRRARVPLPWITPRGGPVCAPPSSASFERPGFATSLGCTSFRHGGFTEGADSDLSDAGLRAAGRHRSARQMPDMRRGPGSSAAPSEQNQPFCRNSRRSFVGIGAWLDSQTLERLGGRTRARTWDPMIKSHLLYQLSYAPGTWSGKPSQEGVV